MKTNDLLLGLVFSIMAGFLAYLLSAPYVRPPFRIDAPKVADSENRSPSHLASPQPQIDIPAFSTTPASSPPPVDDALDAARREVFALLRDEDYLKARARLIELAARAHADGDNVRLGYHLVLLGEVAMEDRDLPGARIFIEESLAAFRKDGNRVGEAYATMQLGRTHIESRTIARHASDAYNLILLARNQVHEFRYDSAQANLLEAISASLEIDRYGTAASALETLARIKRLTGLTLEAEEALFRAAELYASSGQANRAREIIDALGRQGVDGTRISRLQVTIEGALDRFRIDTTHVRQARDYRSLYYHYRNAGEHERAWELRAKAAKVLAQASKRAMYFRQPDVIALLYESNFAVSQAQSLVGRASNMFAAEGANDMAKAAQDLSRLIF